MTKEARKLWPGTHVEIVLGAYQDDTQTQTVTRALQAPARVVWRAVRGPQGRYAACERVRGAVARRRRRG